MAPGFKARMLKTAVAALNFQRDGRPPVHPRTRPMRHKVAPTVEAFP